MEKICASCPDTVTLLMRSLSSLQSRKLRFAKFDQLLIGVALHLISLPQPAPYVKCQRIGVVLQGGVSHLAGGLPEEVQPPLKQF